MNSFSNLDTRVPLVLYMTIFVCPEAESCEYHITYSALYCLHFWNPVMLDKMPKGKAGALGFKNNSRNKVFLHKQLLYIVYISISNDICDIHGRWSQSVNTVNNGSGIWFRWERRLLSELLQTLPGDSLSQSCLLVYFFTSSCSPV